MRVDLFLLEDCALLSIIHRLPFIRIAHPFKSPEGAATFLEQLDVHCPVLAIDVRVELAISNLVFEGVRHAVRCYRLREIPQ